MFEDNTLMAIYKRIEKRGLDDQIDVVRAAYSFVPYYKGQKPFRVVKVPNLARLLNVDNEGIDNDNNHHGFPVLLELEDGFKIGPATLALQRQDMLAKLNIGVEPRSTHDDRTRRGGGTETD